MPNTNYSYQEDWNAIYSTSKTKPWMSDSVSPYLQEIFKDQDFIRKHKDDCIVDIGCGNGTFCRYLIDQGYTNVTGVDASDVIIKQCRAKSKSNLGNNLSFKQQDIVSNAFPIDTKFDIVVCWLVLHHIRPEDVNTFISNLFKCCKTGGTLFLSFLLPEGEEKKRTNSRFTEKHQLNLYPENEVLKHFSEYFRTVTSKEEILLSNDESFRYHVFRMEKTTCKALEDSINTFKRMYILPESPDYKKKGGPIEQTNSLIELLNVFSHVTKQPGSITEDDFKICYKRLFRNVSRFLCKRILWSNQKKDDVIILKMDIHGSQTIYTATKYVTEGKEKAPRPHSRFGSNKKPVVSSRAYDSFLIYSSYLKEKKESGYTLHQHFADQADLKYICFWLDKKSELQPETNPHKDFKYDDDYKEFLKSLFAEPSTTTNGYINYLQNKKSKKPNEALSYCKSFSCFNLGILGFESWGTLMVESQRQYNKITELFYKDQDETELLRDIKNIIFVLKKIDYDYYENLNAEGIKKQATKAAIAQVMARNMSHNIGSHVFSNLLGNDVDNKVHDTSNGCYQELFDIDNKTPQLAYFNRYLKSRMDYLSEVSFGVSDLVSTKMIFSDVMKELDSVRVLLNYISGVKNFKYKFEMYKGNDELNGTNDIGAAFPNDILGCQAFYNIIENIIRNTAKHHSGRDSNKTVNINIRIKDVDSQIAGIVQDASELYCVEIDNGLEEDKIDELVKQQNQLVNKPVLDDESNNLRGSALGLLEMKASAAFLRQINLIDIDSDDYRFNENDDRDYNLNNGVKRMVILKAFKAENNALGYRFFFQKPKEFLFVGDWDIDDIKERTLNNIGVQFMSKKVFLSSLNKGVSFGHPFLIYDTQLCEDDLYPYDSLLSLRRICISDKAEKDRLISSLNNGINIFDITDLKRIIWGKWVKDGTLNPDDIRFIDHAHDFTVFQNIIVTTAKERVDSRTSSKMPLYNIYSRIPKRGQDTEWGRYISNINDHPEICREIREAYENKIIIIDERVQRFAEENKEESIPCWALFESTNIFLPRCPKINEKGDYICPEGKDNELLVPLEKDNVLPLDPENFEEKIGGKSIKDKLIEFVDNNIDNSFLLIHYGILERMFHGVKSDIDEALIKWTKGIDSCSGHAKRVVVTSGRGSHSIDLPSCVCFANLSSVLYACTENRNKYLINYLLNQSRRKRNE